MGETEARTLLLVRLRVEKFCKVGARFQTGATRTPLFSGSSPEKPRAKPCLDSPNTGVTAQAGRRGKRQDSTLALCSLSRGWSVLATGHAGSRVGAMWSGQSRNPTRRGT